MCGMNSSKVGGGSDDIGEGINQNANNYFNVIAFTNDIVIIIVVTSLQKNQFTMTPPFHAPASTSR